MTWALLQALQSSGDARFLLHCQPWVQKLLLGAVRLAALSTTAGTLPRSPVLQHLPLRHLELILSAKTGQRMAQIFADVSRCSTLRSLRVLSDEHEELERLRLKGTVDYQHEPVKLQGMCFRSMPSLELVSLEDCLPEWDLSLPPDCSLFVNVTVSEWQRRSFESKITVLRLSSFILPSLQSFSDLQCLEIDVAVTEGLDLALLQHVPHVRLILGSGENLRMTAGSWQSFEIFVSNELDLVISDVNAFVRDTRAFTFMSESRSLKGSAQTLVQEIQEACCRHGKACHIFKHSGMLWGARKDYVTLSTSKDIAENCPVMHEDGDAEGPAVGIGRSKTHCATDDFWPAELCIPV